MMPDRNRYSRWAVAAAVVTVLGIAEYVVIGLRGAGVLIDAARAYRRFGVAPEIAASVVVLSLMVVAPVSILLGKIAQFQIRLHPEMRGRSLARFAVVAGWLGFILTMIVCTWLFVVLYQKIQFELQNIRE